MTAKIGGRGIGAGSMAFALTLVCVSAVAAPAVQPDPIQVSIGGGGVDSAAFRWSSALSQVLSRPPGLPVCDSSAPCGIPGVIADAQTYDQPQVLAKALAEGRVATGILPANVIFQARCSAAKGQAAALLQVLKALYRQPVQIVLRTDAAIAKPKDFAGKTLAIGEAGSDSEAVALAILDAYSVPRKKMKLLRLSPQLAIAAISSGAAAAAVFVGHSYDVPIGALLARGGTTLLSLPDGPERQKLLRMLPVFDADAIPPGTYPGVPPTSTLAQSVLWVAGPTLDPALAQNLVAAVSEAHNMVRLANLVEPINGMAEGEAFAKLPAPLAAGAERFAIAQHVPIYVVDCPAAPGK